MKPNPTDPAQREESTPWWRIGMVWLVIGGPLLVVVAAIGTAVVAYRGSDPLVTEATMPKRNAPPSELPALQARNHAATQGSR